MSSVSMSTRPAVLGNEERSPDSLERNDSEETDESPFGSTLNTPVDEDLQPFESIHARLQLSVKPGDGIQQLRGLDYFTAKEGPAIPPGLYSPPVMSNTPKSGLESAESIIPFPSLPSIESVYNDSPGISSSGTEASLADLQRASMLYSLPNDPIMVENDSSPLVQDHENVIEDGAADIADSAASEDFILSGLASLSLRSATLKMIRVLLFLPWCIAVGGAILLLPQHLEQIAFKPGYLESQRGIYRFAHWADCAKEHVVIFLASVGVFTWAYPTCGLMLTAGVLAQFLNAWQGFNVDPTVPLGEDDQQTIYLLASNLWFRGSMVGIRKTDRGFLSSNDVVPNDHVSDSDDL